MLLSIHKVTGYFTGYKAKCNSTNDKYDAYYLQE